MTDTVPSGIEMRECYLLKTEKRDEKGNATRSMSVQGRFDVGCYGGIDRVCLSVDRRRSGGKQRISEEAG